MLQSQINVGTVAWHSKISLFVFSSRCSDGINEHLIPLVYDFMLSPPVGEIVSIPPFAIMYFVHRLKHKEIAFLLESQSNLCPDGVQLVFNLLVDSFIIGCFFHI